MKRKPPAPSASAGSVRSAAESGLDALAWAVSTGAARQVAELVRARNQRRQRRRFRIVAGAAAALTLGAGLWRTFPERPVADTAARASAFVSAPAKQILSDGSIAELRNGATLAVEFTPALRRVVLHRGEAHFQVRKDGSRPFVVTAGGVAVRAVGTAFSVSLGAQAVEILVTEGRVAVEKPAAANPASSDPTAAPPPLVLVEAGNRIVVDIAPPPAVPRSAVLAVSTAEQSDRLSWRVPRLELSATPLRDVLSMFNQQGGARLVLDPALGKLQISGTLRADDIEPRLPKVGPQPDIDQRDVLNRSEDRPERDPAIGWRSVLEPKTNRQLAHAKQISLVLNPRRWQGSVRKPCSVAACWKARFFRRAAVAPEARRAA